MNIPGYNLFAQQDYVIDRWRDKARRSLADTLSPGSVSDDIVDEHAQDLYEISCWAEERFRDTRRGEPNWGSE